MKYFKFVFIWHHLFFFFFVLNFIKNNIFERKFEEKKKMNFYAPNYKVVYVNRNRALEKFNIYLNDDDDEDGLSIKSGVTIGTEDDDDMYENSQYYYNNNNNNRKAFLPNINFTQAYNPNANIRQQNYNNQYYYSIIPTNSNPFYFNQQYIGYQKPIENQYVAYNKNQNVFNTNHQTRINERPRECNNFLIFNSSFY